MPRRRRRAARRSNTVSFTTRRGRRVTFKKTGRGHRRTAWNTKFGKAGKACAKKRGSRPGTKKFGACVKAYLRSH